jgi:hypothetical protein
MQAASTQTQTSTSPVFASSHWLSLYHEPLSAHLVYFLAQLGRLSCTELTMAIIVLLGQ